MLFLVVLDSINNILGIVVKVEVASGYRFYRTGTHDVGHVDTSGRLQHVECLLDGYGHIARQRGDAVSVATVDVDILDGADGLGYILYNLWQDFYHHLGNSSTVVFLVGFGFLVHGLCLCLTLLENGICFCFSLSLDTFGLLFELIAGGI